MITATYSYTRTLPPSTFEAAEENIIAALKSEGFGVLTEIDVSGTLKQKIGVDFQRYKIFGACNPPLAHRALTEELLVGLFMPCNVLLFEQGDQLIVAIGKPREMFQPIAKPELASLADELDIKIQRVLERLS